MILKKIHFKSFRNFENNEISFKHNLICIVGANDSGKTNLLLGIDALCNPEFFSSEDVCYYSNAYDYENSPTITYNVNISRLLRDNIISPKEVIFQIHNKEIKIMNDIYETLYEINVRNDSDYRMALRKEEFFDKYNIKTSIPSGSTILIQGVHPKDLESIIDYFKTRHRFKVKTSEKSYIINDKIINNLKNLIKIKFWRFKEEEFNIFKPISYKIFEKKPQKYPFICDLFRKAGVNIKEFFKADDHKKRNLLDDVNKFISNLIQERWTQQDLEFRFEFTTNKNIKFDLFDNGKIIDLNYRGDGFKWFFKFLMTFNEQFGDTIKNQIILLDEPGDYLHPGAQKLLLEQLEDLAKYNQIIYTTHSPFMINQMFPERIIHFKKKKGVTEIKRPWKEGVFDDLLLSSTLGYDLTGLFNWGEFNVFIEGITDKIILEKVILVKIKKDNEIILNLNRFSLLPIGGVDYLENFIRVAQKTGAKYLAFLDNDKAAKDKTGRYHNRPKDHLDTIDHIVFLDDEKSLEDYIPVVILNKAFENLKTKELSYSSFIDQDDKFIDELRKPQIEAIVEKINNNIGNTDMEEIEKITKNTFKLHLILEVKELINEENIDDFNSLIERIQSIMHKAEKLNYI